MKKDNLIGLGILTAIGGVIALSQKRNNISTLFTQVSPMFDQALIATQKLTGPLDTEQVNNLKAIVNANTSFNTDDNGSQLAYIIATAWHESKFRPVRENLNYSAEALINSFSYYAARPSEAYQDGRTSNQAANQQTIANKVYADVNRSSSLKLGNIYPGDGWKYRGGGLGQTTGRRNFQLFTDILGVDLINSPDKVLQTDIAASIIVIGMVDGLFTGRKISDYITNAGPNDFYNARRTYNSLDKAQLINDYAVTIATA